MLAKKILLFFQTSGSIVKVVLMSKFSGILKYTLKNDEKSLLILGNGPSFKKSLELHKDKIIGQHLMCVNSFPTTAFYVEFEPRFYILAAPIVFKKTSELSQQYIDLRDDIFNNLLNKTTWELIMMVPIEAKKSEMFQNIVRENKNIIPIYFNNTPTEGFYSIINFIFKKGWGMPRPHNVLIPAIMNSIKLGFKEIRIIGADHSWLGELSVNDSNEALVHQKHFYDENTSKPSEMKDYVKRPRRLHEIIHKFYLSFKGYWDIKQYAVKRNIKIINCSEETMIDAFDRGKL